MARYERGVKFDHPSHNDGFVSHVARRGAEKTSTAAVWLFLLILAGTVYGAIKGLAHALGVWLLVVPAVLVVLVVLYVILEDKRKRSTSPWIITFTPTVGPKVNGAVRYRTKEEALAAGARFKTVIVGGANKPLRGYEVRWNGLTRSDTAEAEGSGFIPTVTQQGAAKAPSRVPPLSASSRPAPATPAFLSTPLTARPITASDAPASSRTIPATSGSLVNELKELTALHADGALSDAEFMHAKSRLLAGS